MIPNKFRVVCPRKRYSTAKNIPCYFQVVCPQKHGQKIFYGKKYPTLFQSSLSSKTWVNRRTKYIPGTTKMIPHKFQVVWPRKRGRSASWVKIRSIKGPDFFNARNRPTRALVQAFFVCDVHKRV